MSCIIEIDLPSKRYIFIVMTTDIATGLPVSMAANQKV